MIILYYDKWLYDIEYFRLSKQLQKFSSSDSSRFTDEQKVIHVVCLLFNT